MAGWLTIYLGKLAQGNWKKYNLAGTITRSTEYSCRMLRSNTDGKV